MKNTERVSYIRGLAEGLELDENKKEVKVINAIIDLLDDMAFSMSELEDNVNDMADQLDAVDEDLGTLEDDFYDEDDAEENGSDDEGDSCDDAENDGDGCYYEVTCPNCHETVCVSEDLIKEGQMECPNCGETLEFDFDEEQRDTEENSGEEVPVEEKEDSKKDREPKK
jgi:ribosomal protein S27E